MSTAVIRQQSKTPRNGDFELYIRNVLWKKGPNASPRCMLPAKKSTNYEALRYALSNNPLNNDFFFFFFHVESTRITTAKSFGSCQTARTKADMD